MSRDCWRLVLKLILALLALALPIEAAVAGQCLLDKREVKLQQDAGLRFKDLLCSLDTEPGARLRVQFLRLNQAAASVLVAGGKSAHIDKLFGKRQVADNALRKEYRLLLDKFGMRHKSENEGGSLSAGNADQEDEDGSYAQIGESAKLALTEIHIGSLQMPLVDEIKHILDRTDWPAGFNFAYGSNDDANPVEQIWAWRYLTRADLDSYKTNLKRYNKLVTDTWSRIDRVPAGIGFYQYLTRGGMPEKFLLAETQISSIGGCAPLDISIANYELLLDVGVIENTAPRPLSIDAVLGRELADNGLRRTQKQQKAGSELAPLAGTGVTLAPGERLIVPLRLLLAGQETGSSHHGEYDTSEQNYRKIMAAKPGTIFKVPVSSAIPGKNRKKTPEGIQFLVQKTRESFTPPAHPEQLDFAYGPEWALNGLKVGGESVSFSDRPNNFLKLSAGGEVGSCPILYSWDDFGKEWLRHGKVIHTADSAAKETSETRSFEGFVSRFRIAEEELELSHLDAVEVEVELVDGSRHTLPVGVASLVRRDGDYLRLAAGEEVELAFALPSEMDVATVKTTRLTVTGYYERYAQLLVARAIEERAAAPQGSSVPPGR